jgi:ribosome-binding protein aMBF1 (putative translation factor)
MTGDTCDRCGDEVEGDEIDEELYPLVVCEDCRDEVIEARRDEDKPATGRGNPSKTGTQTRESGDERRIRPPEDW